VSSGAGSRLLELVAVADQPALDQCIGMGGRWRRIRGSGRAPREIDAHVRVGRDHRLRLQRMPGLGDVPGRLVLRAGVVRTLGELVLLELVVSGICVGVLPHRSRLTRSARGLTDD